MYVGIHVCACSTTELPNEYSIMTNHHLSFWESINNIILHNIILLVTLTSLYMYVMNIEYFKIDIINVLTHYCTIYIHVYWHYYTICTCITNISVGRKNMWWSEFKSYNVSLYILKYVYIHDDLKTSMWWLYICKVQCHKVNTWLNCN